jgi:hypothetical protein
MKNIELLERIKHLEYEFDCIKNRPLGIISNAPITFNPLPPPHPKDREYSPGGVPVKRLAKIDDTTAFGMPHHNHCKHRVYVDGLNYDQALKLASIINAYLHIHEI